MCNTGYEVLHYNGRILLYQMCCLTSDVYVIWDVLCHAGCVILQQMCHVTLDVLHNHFVLHQMCCVTSSVLCDIGCVFCVSWEWVPSSYPHQQLPRRPTPATPQQGLAAAGESLLLHLAQLHQTPCFVFIMKHFFKQNWTHLIVIVNIILNDILVLL